MERKTETVEIDGRTVRVIRRFPLLYGDLRPGREGRRAPATLINEPTVARLRELFSYDGDSGVLRWKEPPRQARHVKPGDEAGRVHKDGRTFYRGTMTGGIRYKNHVLVWAIVNGAWPDRDLDHIDGNGLNNRIENLREASNVENQQNRHGAKRESSSVFKGVSWFERDHKWLAHIQYSRKIFIGYFHDERAAALMYDKAAQLLFGRFACLNFDPYESSHVTLPVRVLEKIETAQQQAESFAKNVLYGLGSAAKLLEISK